MLACGVVGTGGAPPPGAPGRALPGGIPCGVRGGTGGGWTRRATAPTPPIVVVTAGAFCWMIWMMLKVVVVAGVVVVEVVVAPQLGIRVPLMDCAMVAG